MSLEVPYYAQNYDYYCGPACLSMVAGFLNLRIVQDEIATIAKTSRKRGTPNKNMVKALSHFGITAQIIEPATFADIEQCIEEGKVSIVNYIEPEDQEGHFAVVVGINRTHITLHDPWHGPNFKLKRKDFMLKWQSETGKHVQWLLIATPQKGFKALWSRCKLAITKIVNSKI